MLATASLSDDEIRRAIEDNEAECFLTLQALGEKIQVEKSESSTLLTTFINYWLFNGVFRARVKPSDCDRMVKAWKDHYQARGLPFAVFLYAHSTFPDLEDVLQKNEFVCHKSTTVIFDSENLNTFNVPALNAEFQQIAIRDLKQFEAYSKCWADVFQVPPEIQKPFNEWSTHYGFDESLPLQNIAIMHGNRAAAIAMYYLDSKIAGIYNIGVHPDFRRRGLGIHIAKQIAELARARGVRYLAGNGTEEGMHVYRKAGVREIGVTQRWIRS